MTDASRPKLEDWDVLSSFLPEGWQEKARDLGALRRCRKIPDAGTLLRLLLIHLADGCSLREHHRRRHLQCEATRDLAVSILS